MTRHITHAMVAHVLRRLGIDPQVRFSPLDQDAQYTACRAEELPLYFDLYRSTGVSADDKRVLCSFLLCWKDSTNTPRQVATSCTTWWSMRSWTMRNSTAKNFERHFEIIAHPFEWKFTRTDLNALIARMRERWARSQPLKLAA